MRTRHILIVASFAVLSVVAGCGGGGSPSGQTARPTLRVFNAVPDSGSVSFALDDVALAGAVAYGDGAPALRQVEVGDYDLTVTPAGDPTEADRIVLTLGVDQDFAIVALGLANPAEEIGKRLRLVPFQIDRTRPNGDKARLIVVNALTRETGFENTAVDFQDGDNPQFPLGNIPFAGSRAIVVDSGAQTFEARQSGSELVYATNTQTLVSGGVYVVLVTGVEGGTGAQAPSIRYIPLEVRS